MPFRLKVLVAFHVALTVIALIATSNLPPTIQYLPLIWVAAGIVVGQIGLLSVWLGLGTSSFTTRLLGALAGSGFLAVAIFVWPPSGPGLAAPPSVWLLSFLRTALMYQALLWSFAAACFAVRKWISRLARVPESATPPKAKLQFTVIQMLLLTTVVAMLFGLHGGVVEMGAATQTGQLLLTALMFVIWLINIFYALWSCLGSGKTWLRVPLVLATAVALGLFPASMNANAVDQFGWVFVLSMTLLTIVPTVVVVGSLLVVRSCGFRLLPASD